MVKSDPILLPSPPSPAISTGSSIIRWKTSGERARSLDDIFLNIFRITALDYPEANIQVYEFKCLDCGKTFTLPLSLQDLSARSTSVQPVKRRIWKNSSPA
jgi:hypothetical protein